MLRIQDVIPGSGSEFFYPGSWVKKAPENPDPQQRTFLTQKIETKVSKIWSGMFIPDPESQIWSFSIPDPGVKKHRIPDQDPQHWF